METYIFSARQSGRTQMHVLRIRISCVLFLLLTVLVNADKEETMAHTKYSVAVKTVEGFQVYYIQQDGKAVAEIVPALGNNCYAFK